MSEFQDKSERKSQLNDSCKTAEKFVDIFFAKIDSNRNTIGKMYLEQATLTWNGNPIKGENFNAECVWSINNTITSFYL